MTSLEYLCCCMFFSIIYNVECLPKCTLIDQRHTNSQTEVDAFNALLQAASSTLKLPVYNNETVPNVEEIIKQFQLGKTDEDVYLNFTQLVTKYGYNVQEYQVATEDYYILKMFRIPKPGAPVVLLIHGVLCSSDDWITPGPKTALAYALADAGYDVWLGNCRGNKHSRANEKISPECEEFWNFSFDQMGRYDLPAMIDYSLAKTGKSKLAYVGHSQGCTAFCVMASVKPEYNDKISIMVALSAVVLMGQVRSPLFQLFAPVLAHLNIVTDVVGQFEVGARNDTNAFTSTFCSSPLLAEIFCEFTIYLLSGFNYAQSNTSKLPVIYAHYPAGSSTGQIIHFSQGVVSGRFTNYDNGVIENREKYNSNKPPEYPLEKVTSPMAVFYSHNDWLTSAPDTYTFLKRVPNIVEFYHVPCASFEHFDFLFAKDSDVLVNREVLLILEKYAN